MTPTDEARDRLSDQVFGAKSLLQVKEAQKALRQWLKDYPDEPGMADGFEVLSHRQDFAEQRQREFVQAPEERLSAPVPV